MAIDPLILYHLSSDILECARVGLIPTAGGLPGRICVVPIQVDDDCCDGQLTVAIDRIFNSTDFPAEETDFSPCGVGLTSTDITIRMLRCSPTPTGENIVPTCEQLDAAARIQLEDAYAIRRAVSCCLFDMEEIVSVIGATTMVDNGLCTGSQMTVTLGMNLECGCF